MEITRPWVMGILNVTPDSFHAESRTEVPRAAVARVKDMLEAGADIIDIGACSTRPGSIPVSEEQEMSRLTPILEAVRSSFPDACLSIDTFRACVAEECLRRWDVAIINDISGGGDPAMFRVVTDQDAAYVLMHMRGMPSDMDDRCIYVNVVADVISELAFRLNEARIAGICNVIIDPGFGFAKNTEQNLTILKHLDAFKVLGCPLLAGMSHKRMTRPECKPGVPAPGPATTIALNAIAIEKGASIIRVHDVREGVLTAQIIGRLWNLE